MTAVKNTDKDKPIVPLSKNNALEVFVQMLALIPDEPESDGSEILERILLSTDIADSQSPSSLPAARDMVGRTFMVNGLTKNVSTEAEGLPFYVIVDSTDTRTGEQVRWQTSARSITAWLVKLFLSNALPAEIEIYSAETRSGRKVVDCKIMASSGQLKAITGQ